jgi:hypothetical protein
MLDLKPMAEGAFGEMTETFLCPHCGILSLHMQQEYTKPITYNIMGTDKDGKRVDFGVRRTHLIYRCVGCQQDTYFLTQIIPIIPTGRGVNRVRVVHQHPFANPVYHSSVPEDVKKATWEGERCFSVGAHNACGVMARRAMHALCDDKKAKGKDLYEQLAYLKDNHLITPDLWEWAEELRVIGRSGAHTEWEEVLPDDAEYAIKFLREIIRYVYINPFERNAKRLKETKKKVPKV